MISSFCSLFLFNSRIVQIFKQIYCISWGDVRLSIAIFSAILSSISILSFANPILAISFKSFTSQTSILIRLSLPERSAFWRIASSALCGRETTIVLNPLLIASFNCCAICILFSGGA